LPERARCWAVLAQYSTMSSGLPSKNSAHLEVSPNDNGSKRFGRYDPNPVGGRYPQEREVPCHQESRLAGHSQIEKDLVGRVRRLRDGTRHRADLDRLGERELVGEHRCNVFGRESELRGRHEPCPVGTTTLAVYMLWGSVIAPEPCPRRGVSRQPGRRACDPCPACRRVPRRCCKCRRSPGRRGNAILGDEVPDAFEVVPLRPG